MLNAHDVSPARTRATIAALDAWKDQEHRRLTRELHDDFGQLLAAMKLDLSMLERARVRQADGRRHVENLHELVDAMIASLRRIVAAQPPKEIEETGLYPALGQLVRGFGKRNAIAFSLDIKPPRRPLPVDLQHAVYRIVQESLTNVARHANATAVRITVAGGDSGFELQVSDDGCGATDADLAKTGSFGLFWMRERVVALGGKMRIESGSGTGMLLTIRIPIRSVCLEPSS